MSVKRQLQDWDAALDFVKNCTDVDGSRVAVWGSSFGGGHAITVSSRHPELLAAVSQCPFDEAALEQAIAEFASRERRYGKTSAQLIADADRQQVA